MHAVLRKERRELRLGLLLGLGVTGVAALAFSQIWLPMLTLGLTALLVATLLGALSNRRRLREVRALERAQGDLNEYLRGYHRARLREGRFMVAAWLGSATVWLGSLVWYAPAMDTRKLIFCVGFGVFLLCHAVYTWRITLPGLRRELEPGA